MTKFNKWIVTILITVFACTSLNAVGIKLFIVHAEEGYTEEDVEKIVINKAPKREYYFGDIEYGWLDEDGNYEFYPSDLTGLEFTVFYTDGESHTYSDALKIETW